MATAATAMAALAASTGAFVDHAATMNRAGQSRSSTPPASTPPARTRAAELVQLTAHLSRWLDERGLVAEGLTSEVIESFLVDRRQHYRRRRSGQALGPLLGCLRSVGTAPGPTRRADGGKVALLVDRYRRYLLLERGLSVLSARRYLLTVGKFLDQVPSPIEVDFGS